jgi:hypothetical protein
MTSGVAFPVSRRLRLPRELASAIYQGSCVLFIGAGLSQVYAGLPNGRELARRLGEELVQDRTLAADKKRFLQRELARSHGGPDLASVARYYAQHERADPRYSGRPRLLNTLSEILDVDLNDQQIAELDFLVKQPWRAIYTTNYDMTVEYVLDHGGVPYHRVSKNEDLLRLPPLALKFVKLHGSIDELFHDGDGPRLVLTDADYNFHREGRELLFDELRNDLAKYPFLFLGYGLRDEHFTRLVALLDHLVNLRQRRSFVLASPEDVNPFDRDFRMEHGQVTILGNLREFVAILEWEQDQFHFHTDQQDLIEMSWTGRLAFRKEATQVAKLYYQDMVWGGTRAADRLRELVQDDLLKGVSLLRDIRPTVTSIAFKEVLDRELDAISSGYIEQFANVVSQPGGPNPEAGSADWHGRCELALRSLPLIWDRLDQPLPPRGGPAVSRQARTVELLTRFILDCEDPALVYIACYSVNECFTGRGVPLERLNLVGTILGELDEAYGGWRYTGGGKATGEVLRLLLADERRPVVRALHALLEPLREIDLADELARTRRILLPDTYANPHVHWELLALGVAVPDPPSHTMLEDEPWRFLLDASAYMRGQPKQEVTNFLDGFGPGGFNRALRQLVDHRLEQGGLFERRAIALFAVGGTSIGMEHSSEDYLESIDRYLAFLETHHCTGPDAAVFPLLSVPALVESIFRYSASKPYGEQELALYRRLLGFATKMQSAMLWEATLRRLTQFLPEFSGLDGGLIDVVLQELRRIVMGSDDDGPDPWLKYRAMTLIGELLEQPSMEGDAWRQFQEWARVYFLEQRHSRPLHRVVRRRVVTRLASAPR